ncbi:hypothetical protein [Clostridium akagii]|uniref:hypothetical protein n=1 Tax=Clostridium akagii TaxID=91623 RepID=UPI00047A3D1E|nr:hypothetical protein [Clostridium akagii]
MEKYKFDYENLMSISILAAQIKAIEKVLLKNGTTTIEELEQYRKECLEPLIKACKEGEIVSDKYIKLLEDSI